MKKYYKTYLQLESDGSPVIDTVAAYGMYCMENPFIMCKDVKEPTKRTWYDEHGDDEYIPSAGLYMASYENDVKFGFHGSAFGANEKLKLFLEYLRKGMLKMYCEFNRIGRQHVRFKSVKQELVRDASSEDILVVTVTFKFNDPVTDVAPVTDTSGNITSLGEVKS